MISVICLILVAAVAALAVGLRTVGGGQKPKAESGEISTSSKAITALCQPTDYKETCINSLKSANTSDPKELIQLGFQVAVNALKEAMKNSSSLKELAKDSRTSQALEDCEELMDSAIDDLQNSFDKLGASDASKLGDYVHELKIWLSGAVTFEESCLDEFENITNNDAGEKMRNILQASRELTSNGLAMVSEISSILTSFNPKRRLLSEDYSDQNGEYYDQNGSFSDEDGYPSWFSSGRRKLLAATAATIKPDAVVAKDGSGQFKTITDALNAVPKKNSKTFVIYIKAGVYQETVMVTKNLTNVMFLGDGPTKTKITGNKNYIDGTNTMRTATPYWGPNFIAKDMGFENSAGAIKHQAVALRVQADKSLQSSRTAKWSSGNHWITKVALSQLKEGTTPVRPLESSFTTASSLIDDIIQPEGWLPWMGDFALNTCWYGEYGNRGPGAVQTGRVTWKGIKKVDANQANSFTVAQFIKDNWIKPAGVPYFPGMINHIGTQFHCQGHGFENSAGAIKHQAVALRVQADKSLQSSRTAKWSSGNLDNQSCIVTAQGRNNSRSATGIVLQNCIITGDPAYLPVEERWLPWMGDFALNTCWYGEYGNRGPGAVQTGRVTWKGIKKVDANQANSFTVAQFIKDNGSSPPVCPIFLG
ncbi:hypothetical protein JRO89_XS03G0168000 [Xanthoceras sorbifolium]|uniref:Pectinesterase n=1 Tax=Xanthoceras sorbifolium TaxID=99658 RepID=A0ABQ8IAF6_9ROSI|nr:hypothetical protein JRO89_XS03G0168000 [Xanthoceras sorbifolium]